MSVGGKETGIPVETEMPVAHGAPPASEPLSRLELERIGDFPIPRRRDAVSRRRAVRLNGDRNQLIASCLMPFGESLNSRTPAA